MASAGRGVLSFAQERLWLLEQLVSGSGAYLSPHLWLVTGALDVPLLERAFREVLDRHPMLRSRLVVEHSRAAILVGPAADVRFERYEVGDEQAARVLAEKLAWSPLDPMSDPMSRAEVIRIGPQQHLFCFTAHHMAFDGLSRVIFEENLSLFYQQLHEETAFAEPRPPSLYTDYSAAQRAAAAGPEMAEGLRYWRDRLAGMPASLEFPADHPRPPVPTLRGAELDFVVAAPVIEGLDAVARSCRTSLFVVTFAAYQGLLGLYSGSRDVGVGVPFAGRADPDTESVIGFFVNTVVQRSDLSDDPVFLDHVCRVRDSVLDAMDHQDVPFDFLVENVDGARDPAYNPLFQHWFDLTESEGTCLRLLGAETLPFPLPDSTVRFDTELHLNVRDGVITGKLTYATDLFTGSRMRQFADHYRLLLANVAADPSSRLSTLVAVPGAQRRELLRLGRGPLAEAQPELALGEAFDRVAHTWPDAVAVQAGPVRMSYRELHARAEVVTRRLEQHGIGQEDVVAVWLPRDTTLVPALLGVTKAGAAYLPLDTRLPPGRVAALLADSGARLIVTTSELAGTLPAGVPTVFVVEGLSNLHGSNMVEDPAKADRLPTTLDALCYVVYTSGSTGTPKGVAVSHRNLSALIRWHVRRYRLRPGDRIAQLASISFDAAAWEIWPALLSGAQLDLCPDEIVRSPADLAAALTGWHTTLSFAPTAVAEELIRQQAPPMLRTLLTGGDVFRPGPQENPAFPVVNHYGPTENTVVATATDELGAPWSALSIGRPIDGVSAYVLDDALRLVPQGTTGELFLGGSSVARGYLRSPGRTAERFLPDPFGGPGERMYRTGDLVRWRVDGQLDFLGRADAQIKILGHRIEPAEVEAALLAHPRVPAAVVVMAEAGTGQRVLVAYLVEEKPAPTAGELREFARERLPWHMVPAAFVFLPELPYGVTGKVDRERLPTPEVIRAAFFPPRTDAEQTVSRLWCELLGTPRAGVHDDFFALGGTSMSAARLAVHLRETFDIDVSLREIFEHRTVAALAELAEARLLASISAMSPEQIAAALDVSSGTRPGSETGHP
jgi:amino acid adenylation domain-containing protein